MSGSIRAFKNGTYVQVRMQHTRAYKRPDINKQLDPVRIIGWDTETLSSHEYSGEKRTCFVQVDRAGFSQAIPCLTHDMPAELLIDSFFSEFAVVDEKSQHAERSRDERGRIKGGGRHRTLLPVLLVGYNVEYDLGQIFPYSPEFRRIVLTGQPSTFIPCGKYQIEVVRMIPNGSAPSFDWYIRHDGLVCHVLGIDMWGYWKYGLDFSCQALGIETKEPLSKLLFELAIEDFTPEEKQLFERYAIQDAVVTRGLYDATAALLVQVDPVVITKRGVLPPSAPSAAIRIAMNKFDGNFEYPPLYAEQLGALAYCGGNVYNRKKCYAEDITVDDMSSAYPSALAMVPDLSICVFRVIKPQAFRLSLWRGKIGVVVVSGTATDPHYPALRHHDEENKRLAGVYGKFSCVVTTLTEVAVGVADGSLVDVSILGGYWMDGTSETSGFRRFVCDVYDLKRRASETGNAALRAIAKLLMNSAYGKLLELIGDATTFDTFAAMTEIPDFLYTTPDGKKCITPDTLLSAIKSRYVADGCDGLLDLSYELAAEYRQFIKKDEDGNESWISLKTLLARQEVAFEAGTFYLPSVGCQVTGITSARVALMGRITRAIQMDTDSVMYSATADCKQAYQQEYSRIMDLAGVERFIDGPMAGLGEWEEELSNGKGYFIRNKMYAIKYQSPKGESMKEAHHAMPGVRGSFELATANKKETAYKLIEQLFRDGEVTYTTAPSPMKARESALRGMRPGLFTSTEMTVVYEQSPCLEENKHGEKCWKRYSEQPYETTILSTLASVLAKHDDTTEEQQM